MADFEQLRQVRRGVGAEVNGAWIRVHVIFARRACDDTRSRIVVPIKSWRYSLAAGDIARVLGRVRRPSESGFLDGFVVRVRFGFHQKDGGEDVSRET